ncbi:MAG TPA: peptide-methionine (S)-S-oxide reductase MsrA [Pirellulaceae bacterium]|jgi:peptide-methionine (S)-S-oxide reductase|nr:peptide-methionine (S)-S-oxide reductase MsrA [Pirellulaceae bacterium]
MSILSFDPPSNRVRSTRGRFVVKAALASLLVLAGGCQPTESVTAAQEPEPQPATPAAEPEQMTPKMATATFGNGCFWCTEAVFLRLDGVEKVVSGYMGGSVENPTYQQVCTGYTGHAEVIRITYDENKVDYEELLEIFWKTHDPTTLNRQGYDVGTQYRSVVFYHSPEQKELAEKWKTKLDDSKVFDDPIVTEITEASTFYPAEDYHQNYYAKNPRDRYCRMTIGPKYKKLETLFADKLKPEEDAKR